MVKPEIVAARLEKLKEYLKTLGAVKKYDLKRFTEDPFIHGAAERYLHLLISGMTPLYHRRVTHFFHFPLTSERRRG